MSATPENNSKENITSGAVKATPMAVVLKILKDGKLKNTLASVLLSKRSVMAMMLTIFIMLILMIMMISAIISISQSKTPEPVVLATTSDGGTVRVLTLSSPNISMRGLTNKVGVDIGYCLTFDSNTYEAVSQYCAANVFTGPGYQSFKKSLESTPVGASILQSKPFIIDSSILGVPILSNEGRYLFGYDAVEIEVPIYVKTEVLGLKPSSSKYIARVRMIQVDNPESTNAYKINEINVARVNEK